MESYDMNSTQLEKDSTKIELSNNAQKFLKNIDIIKVRVDKKNRKWILLLVSKSIVLQKEIDEFKEDILKHFKELKDIEVNIDYERRETNDMESLFKEYWPNILYVIGKVYPSFKGCEKNCSYEIREKLFILKINNSVGVELLKQKNCQQMLKDMICNDLRININVALEYTDDTDNKIQYIDFLQEQKVKEQKYIKTIIRENLEDKSQPKNSVNLLGKKIDKDSIEIYKINTETNTCIFQGKVIKVQSVDIRNNNSKIVNFDLTDYTSSITVKAFLTVEQWGKVSKEIVCDAWLKIKGHCQYDKYEKDIVVMAQDINIVEVIERRDDMLKKRIELHAHTQSSAMDGVAPVDLLVKRAAKWGHTAIAITDHGVVQAFPEACEAGKKHGVKIIYGVEAYLLDDLTPIVTNPNNKGFEQCFVVLDLETTGLAPGIDRITEIGAVKIIDGKVVDSFNTFINPGIAIPHKITQITGITDYMVKDAPNIEQILGSFLTFIGAAVIVAHNAKFDLGFIMNECEKMNIEINNTVIDTLMLTRLVYRNLKTHKLNKIASHLKISLGNHHRALDDAQTTASILLKTFKEIKEKGITQLNQINDLLKDSVSYKDLWAYHAIILVKDKIGLRNLYELISLSHMKYFYKKPRIPKSVFSQFREGLLLGTACEAGELFSAIKENRKSKAIREIAEYYDYFEIQPLANNEFLLREERVKSQEHLMQINKDIVNLGEKYNKPVVATGDVHFVDPEDECYRRVIMVGQGFQDAEKQAPLYLHTTEEMLEEFHYLGKQKAFEVVVENTEFISKQIQIIKPIPDKLYPPIIEGAEDEIRNMTIQRAKEIYGDDLPEAVNKRLSKELQSIIDNKYAVLYLVTHKLVKKSMEDGYLVGSRGSVGSSFVATLCNITEVNPLPPHYICPGCKYADFNDMYQEYSSGVDLPYRLCPDCNTELKKEGFNIPFEVFLGFKGDKVPDIDLNFSGEYQSIAHKQTEHIFGKEHVFRAGTIGTIAEKTAYGFVRGYMENKNAVFHNAEINRLISGCTGVKRTTGQHPGGVMIVPKDKHIYEFTPIQFPADDKDSDIITTHFDYHAVSDRLVKLDILGHDDPTMIKMLEDLTGIKASNIPLDDPATMSIFSSTKALGVNEKDIKSKIGTFGIPEFGTKFVRQMLEQTRPTTFTELVRISGLSHGENVWINNAQDLIKNKTAKLSEVISTRDDIMVYLLNKELEPTTAFKIMENVRKGKGLSQSDISDMKKNNVPDWFISSCTKIKYMFPKAHAVAYVIMAFRIAYFKVHYPKAFYTAYFTVRADDFDAELVSKDKKTIKKHISEYDNKGNKFTQKEKNLLTILEVALEMYCRDIIMLPVNLYKSDATDFIIKEEGILPSLNSLQGLGINAAKNIVRARKKGKFISIEDLVNRSKISKTVIEILDSHGCIKDIPKTNQISLF